MKTFLLLLACCLPLLMSTTVTAQRGLIDSLVTVNKHYTAQDAGKLDLLLKIAAAHEHVDKKTGLRYATEAHALAVKLKDKKGMAAALDIQGDMNDGAAAIRLYREALAINRSIGNRDGMFTNLKNMMLLHVFDQNEKQAMEIFREVQTVFSKEPAYRLQLCLIIAEPASSFGLTEIAQTLSSEAMKLAESVGDKKSQALALRLYGNLLQENDPRKALQHFEKALTMLQEQELMEEKAITLENAADCYLDLADTAGAIQRYQQARQLYRQVKNYAGVQQCDLVLRHLNTPDYAPYMYQLEVELTALTAVQERQYLQRLVAEAPDGYLRSLLLSRLSYHYERYDKTLQLKYALESYHAAHALQYGRGIARAQRELARYYYYEDIERCSSYIDSAIQLAKRLHDKSTLAKVYYSYGGILESGIDESGKRAFIESSIHFLTKSIRYSEEVNDKLLIGEAYRKIGYNYIWKHQYEEARKYFELSADFAREAGDPNWEESRRRSFVDYYNFTTQDSLDAAKERADALYLQQKIAAAKKDQELKIIRQAREIQDLQFARTQAELQAATLLAGESEKQLRISEQEKQLQASQLALQATQLNLQQKALESKQRERIFLLVSAAGLLSLLFFIYRNYRNQKKANSEISLEKRKSEELLLNILPVEVADEIKQKGKAKARVYENITVLFTDFVNFTAMSETLPAEDVVSEIDRCFQAFDAIIEKHGLEKIKTIGDGYMAASGMPIHDSLHAIKAVNAALEMSAYIQKHGTFAGGKQLEMRIGLHSGRVVAGIVGVKKFAYDIWGDTVNTAARMEQVCEAGKINISGPTYELVSNHFHCTYRGKVAAKNKGEIDMYYVTGAREIYREPVRDASASLAI